MLATPWYRKLEQTDTGTVSQFFIWILGKHNSNDTLNYPCCRKWGVKKITWEEDTEPYALARDQKIKDIAKAGNY